MYTCIFFKNNEIEPTGIVQSEQLIPLNRRIIVSIFGIAMEEGMCGVLFEGSIFYVIIVYFYYNTLWILIHGAVLQVCFYGRLFEN